MKISCIYARAANNKHIFLFLTFRCDAISVNVLDADEDNVFASFKVLKSSKTDKSDVTVCEGANERKAE